MTVRLDWPPDVVERLTEEARRRGLSLPDHLLQLVQHRPENGGATTQSDDARKRAEAVVSILENRKGNILGPDLSVRDLIEEGRRF